MTYALTPPASATDVTVPTRARPDSSVLVLAAVFVLAPVLRMLSIVAHPLDTHDAAATLAHIDDVSLRWALVHVLEPFSTLLLGVAGFGLLRLTPERGRRIATAGAVMFAIGCAALALLVYAHGQAYLFMTDESVNQAHMSELYAQFHEGIPLTAPFIPLFVLGAVLLAIGLIKAGTVSKVAAVVFVIATFVPNTIPQDDSLVLAGIVGSAPMIAAMSVFAATLLRRTPPRVEAS